MEKADIKLLKGVPLAQSSVIVLLLALLILFAHGSYLLYGGISLSLLAGYHVLADHYYGVDQIRAAGLLIPHIAVYLALCAFVIWATTGEDESPYWVVYILPVAVAASSLRLPGTLVACLVASLLFLGQVPPVVYLDPTRFPEEIPELLLFCLTFFIVGVLLQTFSETNRRQLREQQRLNEKLLENQQALKESLARLEKAEEYLRRKERLAALGEMSAGLAHEIRNPLGILSSSAQLLGKRMGTPPEGVGALLDIIQEETTRLNSLINDFLTFGRPSAPSRRTCDLGALVRRVVDHVGAMAGQKGVTLTAQDIPSVTALVDPDQIQQVLLNLLLNALDATESTGGIAVSMVPTEETVRIDVIDTGEGIDPAVQSRIFDPFFTTKDKGTGLGLSNAYKIIESHGGELTVHSTPHAGSTFSITLPLEG